MNKEAYMMDESPEDFRISELIEAIKKDVAEKNGHNPTAIKGLKSVRLAEKIRKKQNMQSYQ